MSSILRLLVEVLVVGILLLRVYRLAPTERQCTQDIFSVTGVTFLKMPYCLATNERVETRGSTDALVVTNLVMGITLQLGYLSIAIVLRHNCKAAAAISRNPRQQKVH